MRLPKCNIDICGFPTSASLHSPEEVSMSACQESERERTPSSRPCQSQQCRDKLCCLEVFCRLRGSSQEQVYSHLHGPLGTSPGTLLAKPRPPHHGAWGRAKPLHTPAGHPEQVTCLPTDGAGRTPVPCSRGRQWTTGSISGRPT